MNHTSSITALEALRRSIAEQVEATILQSPECSRTASLRVDRLMVCRESIGGQS